MKFLIVLLALFVAIAIGQTSPSQQLENALNKLKDQMPCGFPEFGIPPMEPYNGADLKLSHKILGFITMNGEIEKYIVKGLQLLQVSDVDLSILKLQAQLKMTISELRFSGNYKMQTFIIEFMKLHGHGECDITIKDLECEVLARIGLVNKVFQVTELKPKCSIGGIQVKVTGLTIKPFEGMLNKLIAKSAMNYMKDNQDEINNKIREKIVPEINYALKDKTLKDILAIITNPKTLPVCIPPAA